VATAGLGAVRDSFMTTDASGAPTPRAIVKYMPAISTAAVAVGGYVLANKFAPRFKGAVIMGGLLAAVVQAVAAGTTSTAADGTPSTGIVASARKALGLGDYTTVGGRAYAEGGMFREIGDYTTVGASEARDGGAYSNQRPRRDERDNATQWATSGLGRSEAREGGAYSRSRPRATSDNATEWATNGLDDTTEFAPGEGGVLAGGMFRGPSTR
jgi:hypothetical protein